MSITVDLVFEQALCLTDESRILLAERLLESVPPDRNIIESQIAVSSHRINQLESGEVVGIPGNEALDQVRSAILHRSRP